MAFARVHDRRRAYHQCSDPLVLALVEDRGEIVQAAGRLDADHAILFDHVVATERYDQPVIGIGQGAGHDLLPAATHDVLGGVAPDAEIKSRDGDGGGLEHPADPASVLRVTDPLDEGVTDEAHAYIRAHPANLMRRPMSSISGAEGRAWPH